VQQQALTFTPPSGATPLNYLFTLPTPYAPASDQRWPLLLFLHGSGERGHDLQQLKQYGIPHLLEHVEHFPFITVAPQCPPDTDWAAHNETLIALLDGVIANYNVEPSRVYLTGLSMGGRGAWHLALLYPHRFAAMAPICGRIPDLPGFLDKIARLKALPIWVFHGAQDAVVPIANSEKLVAALQAAGGNIRFTVYPAAGHDSWTETYDNTALYDWLLQHTLSE